MLSKGKRAARKLKRAQILLAADAGCSDEEIARTVAVGRFHRVPDQAAFRARQSGTGAERGSASWGGAQAHRQGRSLAGGDGCAISVVVGIRRPLERQRNVHEFIVPADPTKHALHRNNLRA
jgi:hypothetical protein